MNTPQDRHPATMPLPTTGYDRDDRPTEQLPPVQGTYDENYYGPQEYGAPPRRRSRLGRTLLVGAILVLALLAAAIWTLQAMTGALSSAAGEPAAGTQLTPMATEVVDPAEAAAEAAALEEMEEALPAGGAFSEKLRRVAFASATATERGLLSADAEESYDEIAGLCATLDAGASPASAVSSFIDGHSTVTTVAPIAKMTATGRAIQCPGHYQSALTTMSSFTPEQLPESPSWEWLP